MRIGHAGFALVAKGLRPRVPLLLLVIAAYGPDLIELGFDVIGRHDKILSHSLLSVFIGATLLSAGYFAVRRDGRDAIAIWLTYVSHWPADFITGHKPTWPGGPIVGLDFYDRQPWEWLLEFVVLATCWLIYSKRRKLSLPAL